MPPAPKRPPVKPTQPTKPVVQPTPDPDPDDMFDTPDLPEIDAAALTPEQLAKMGLDADDAQFLQGTDVQDLNPAPKPAPTPKVQLVTADADEVEVRVVAHGTEREYTLSRTSAVRLFVGLVRAGSGNVCLFDTTGMLSIVSDRGIFSTKHPEIILRCNTKAEFATQATLAALGLV